MDGFYEFMFDWKDVLPTDSNNESLSYRDIDRASLRKARRQAYQEFVLQRSSECQPVHLESQSLGADIRDIKFEALLEKFVGDNTELSSSDIELMAEDHGDVLIRDDISAKAGRMETDLGEILSRDNTPPKQNSSIALVSQPEVEPEDVMVHVEQAMQKKRKATDILGRENESSKSSVSIVEKAKKKKKRKVASAEHSDHSDPAKGSKNESGNASSLKKSENGNVDMKDKIKVKTSENVTVDMMAKVKVKPRKKGKPVAEQNKGSSMDEIDDIFGF